MDIFERHGGPGEPGGYKFVCPGVAIGEPNVAIAFRDRQWHLSYTDRDERTYTGVADCQVAAYLARGGMTGQEGAIFDQRADRLAQEVRARSGYGYGYGYGNNRYGYDGYGYDGYGRR